MLIIIGKSGQLAQSLIKLCHESDVAAIALGRNDINLLDANDVKAKLGNYKCSGVINASAYTAVDKAETDELLAYDLNELAVRHLAQACKQLDIHLVHVSTDYVFAGDKGSPYLPTDLVAPNGVYGASKAAGEHELLQTHAQGSCVLRTSWVYSTQGTNFVTTMLRLMKEKPSLGVIDDQIGSPTSSSTLAIVWLSALQNKLQGVHHVSDEGVASWYDFAASILDIGLELGLLDKGIPIKPIPSSEYPTPAKRPHYSVLCKASLKQNLPDIQLPNWRHALRQVIGEIAGN